LAAEGVIVININYRLGVFGFLGSEYLRDRDGTNFTTGNYGTLDVLKALEWVNTNIASFGGDPNNVTIFGESAGSSMVANILAAPDKFVQNSSSEYLFHGAIMQSGGFVQWSSTPMNAASQQYKEIMLELGCVFTEVDCLIGKTTNEIQLAFETVYTGSTPPCREGCAVAPAVDS
jgi:carboxylesterase type B